MRTHVQSAERMFGPGSVDLLELTFDHSIEHTFEPLVRASVPREGARALHREESSMSLHDLREYLHDASPYVSLLAQLIGLVRVLWRSRQQKNKED